MLCLGFGSVQERAAQRRHIRSRSAMYIALDMLAPTFEGICRAVHQLDKHHRNDSFALTKTLAVPHLAGPPSWLESVVSMERPATPRIPPLSVSRGKSSGADDLLLPSPVPAISRPRPEVAVEAICVHLCAWRWFLLRRDCRDSSTFILSDPASRSSFSNDSATSAMNMN